MARKIEHLLRLVADMQQFSNPAASMGEELSEADLDLVAAATGVPNAPDLPENEDPIF